MQKYVLTSLLFFVPVVAAAADHCTNPTEYTIDRRCYVTDEQKTQKPYNAVVALCRLDVDDCYCTGVVVKTGEKIYLYTARHCMKKADNDSGNFRIKYINGDHFFNYDELLKKEAPDSGHDLAVYQINRGAEPLKTIAAEKTNNKISDVYYEARLVGYGALKIMSDEEIASVKEKYEQHLKDIGLAKEDSGLEEYIDKNGKEKWRLKLLNENVDKFFENSSMTNDESKLKVSFCKYGKKGGQGCQGWGGNSGGPIFDKDGRVMGIAQKGGVYFGDPDRHIEAADHMPDYPGQHTNVNLLKKAIGK